MTLATRDVAALPGPAPMRALGWRGNMIRLYRDPIGYMRMLQRDYGPIATLMRGMPGWVFAFGPEYNRLLLTNPDLFYADPFISAPPDSALRRLTAGLLSMNGPQHRQQRRLMQPAFHRRQIERYRDDMVALTERALAGWRPGQPIDLAAEMRRLTMAIVARCLFGLDVGPEADRLGGLIKRWIALNASPFVDLYPRDRPGTPYRQLLRRSEQLEASIRAMIARKRAALAGQDDVLATLIQARDDDGGAMTDVELIGQANVLFLAGHETSSNALTWTLFLLAQHPRIMADLRDELAGALGGAAPTAEQLAQLPLLDRVVKESMRLLPPASYGYRVSAAPFELGPYAMPRGSGIFFSQYITHHMPELYPEPQRFRPDRWLSIDPSPYEYLPFGAGPRMCIGAAFALMEIKIVLALVAQGRQLALRPGARIDRHVRITLAPRHGMPMLVAPPGPPAPPAAVRGNIHEMVDLTRW